MDFSTRLCALIIVVGWCGAVSAQPLNDPGPVWAGITDTTALRLRIEHHVAESESLLDRVRGVSGPRTAENTVVPLARAEFKLYEARWLARVGLNAHPDSAFRAVAQAWETRLAEPIAELSTDRTLYEALVVLDLDALSPEMRYVVQRELAGYRRDGVDLDEGTRALVAALRTRITEVGTRFERNIFTDIKTIRVHPDSLAGVPMDWVAANASGAPDGDGLVTVTLTPANFEPLATSAESADLRARAARAYFTRGYPQNVPVIDSLRALRHELAGLLGFDSWAAYSLEPMMAGSPERVARFLDEVDEASAEAARREAAALLAIRQREEPGATSVSFLEQRYWANKLRQQAYGFDQQALRAYFPYAAVRDGILSARVNLWLSDLSLDLYAAPPEADPTADVEQRAAEYLPAALPEWAHPSTYIPHLNAYGPSYYTYVWSEVIARDRLTGFDPDDLLGPEAGRRYRDLVLAPTGTAPSAVLVERFLGRPFNADAWRDWLNEGEAEE